MNVTLRTTLVSAVLAAAVQAAPFMAIGDGAELFLTGKLGVRSDDNVLLANRAESDLIFEFAPGVDLTFGKGAQLQGVLSSELPRFSQALRDFDFEQALQLLDTHCQE